MNKWTGIGRITANPEIRYTASNVEVCSFTLAVNRKFKNAEGDYEADFINCVAFKNTAKVISSYVLKGDLLGIEGRIQTRTYENSEGRKVYVTEIIVEQLDFLTPKKKEQVTTTPQKEADPFAEFGETVTIDDNFLD